MNLRILTITELMQRLAAGWMAERGELAQEFASRWQTCLDAPGEIRAAQENALRFDLGLSGIRLHGIHNVACLAVAGSGDGVAKTMWNFWHQINSTDRLVFVLALSDQADEQARAALPNARCLRLRPEQIYEVLSSCDPREKLKEFIRQQLPCHFLVPYNITLPVNTNMFFGRQRELDRLCYEPETSFAIAGAGRLGKTSLALQFHRRLVCENDPRASRRFHVDFYDCPDRTADGVASFLAMAIDPSKRSYQLTLHDLVNFLKYQSHKQGGPLELFLDELDQVCHLPAFDVLTMAARRGLCRLVLCGRGNLLKAVMNEHSPLKGRVELIRLQPLDEEPARRLILEPLQDLGFKIIRPQQLLNMVFHWTGRLPHLLQYYGKRLANLAMAEGAGAVLPEMVSRVRSDFETAQIFAEQLEGLAGTQTRSIALGMLYDGRRHFTIPIVQEIAEQHGIHLDSARALDVCNDLVINHVLAWSEDAYCIANHSLVHYARKMRLQDGAFKVAYV